jgi:anaerobic magnesium-protoporphyrin IX monomethyl ester cyclase
MKIIIIENPRPLTIEHYNDVANAPLSASLNSGYALAVAREAGWETGYLDFSACRDNEKTLAAAIRAEDADIILFHWVYSWGNEAAVRAVIDLLKRGGSGLIGAFGLFPTLSCAKLSNYAPQLDFIIVGEFEQTLEELLQNYNKSHKLTTVPGIYRQDDPFTARRVISDLSQLPVPDDLGTNCAYPTMNIAASRGCFGDCGFCFISSLYGCTTRRERTIASFAREFEQRRSRRNIQQLYFIDPTFIGRGSNQQERVRANSEIVRNSGIPFGFETRVDSVAADLVTVLAKNGATSLFLGIESGCDAVLHRINKRIRKPDVVRAVHQIKENGIRLTVGFIMFEPDTTLDELLENYAFLEELDLLSEHDTTINMLYHSQIVLAGSRPWTRFEREGRLLVDEKLPFEANYRFKHDNVARVCAAMKKLAAEYFLRINSPGVPRSHTEISGTVDHLAVNQLLKDSFRAFVSHADTCSKHQFSRLEETFVTELRGCL